MNWLLLVVIAILAIGAFLGGKAGLVKAVFSLASTIAVIILTTLLSPLVTGILQENATITGTITEKLDEMINLEFMEEGMENENDPLSYVENLSLPESIKEILTEAIESVLEDRQEEAESFVGDKLEALESYICEVLSDMIINAIGFVITLVVVAAGVALLCFLLDVLSKLPVIHQLNTLAGAAFGALEGLMIVWIFFIILTMFASTEFGQNVFTMIGESELLGYLYDHNILSKIIAGKL